jgi:hypothetical protein
MQSHIILKVYFSHAWKLFLCVYLAQNPPLTACHDVSCCNDTMIQQFCTVVQAGLNAFEANEFGDLVGQLSSSCVAGLDPELVGDREGHLKELGKGSSSPDPTTDAATSQEDAAASSETVEAESGEASEDEDVRRAKPTWNAKIINGSGWRVGLNGRKIYIEYELFNIFSPIGAFF